MNVPRQRQKKDFNDFGKPTPPPLNSAMRVPPQNIDAERALLGALLLRGQGFLDIADTVNGETFYVDKHRIIFETMFDIYRTHDPIDLISVSSRLREKGLLDQAGGLSYLTELTTTTPSASNIDYYAKMVNNKSTLRAIINAGYTIGEYGFDEDNPVEHVIDRAEKALFGVTQSGQIGNKSFTSIKDVLPTTMENIERLASHSGELRGVPTGFTSLDNKLSGLQGSDLIILAARPSVGKTSFALDIARRAALYHGAAVGVFSLEMSKEQLVDRMLASESRVDLWKIRTGKGLTEDDHINLRDGICRISEAPIYIDDESSTNILRMRSTARRMKMQHGLKLLVVDYLQLINPVASTGNVVTDISEISRALKGIARELNVPILALSQLSRAVEARGGKPRLSDLRDSGAIEQDADIVMFIHREKDEEVGRTNTTEILIEKHRNGPTGKIDLYFDADKACFLEIEKNDLSAFEAYQPTNVVEAMPAF